MCSDRFLQLDEYIFHGRGRVFFIFDFLYISVIMFL